METYLVLVSGFLGVFGRRGVFAWSVLDVQSRNIGFRLKKEGIRKCWDLQGQGAEEVFLNPSFGCKYLS